MGNLSAKDICQPIEGWSDPQDTIEQGCKAIQSQALHLVPLGCPEQPYGVVSAGDVVAAIAKGLDITTAPLTDIASTDIQTIESSASLLECLKVFHQNPVRSLFVIENGTIQGSISKDILLTEHSAILDTAIQVATKDLQSAADTRDSLLGTAAHDIRNPLGVILAWCELLADTMGDELNLEVVEGMETIRKQAQQILEIVNQFLDVTKIEAGKVRLDITTFDPAEIIVTAYKANLTQAQRKGIPLENNAPLSMKPFKADKNRIESVIQKLIKNTIKYSNPGELAQVRAFDEEAFLKIEVQDQGLGIPLNEQAQVFTPFAKTSSRPTGGETGTGLGMAISRKVIEMHGGSLSIASNPGEGTTFTIKLPR